MFSNRAGTGENQVAVRVKGRMTMGFEKEQFLFEAEDGTRYYTWRSARVELEPVAGTITIYGYHVGKLTITVPVSEIASCEIVEREETKYYSRGLEASGCGTDLVGLLLLRFIAIIEGIIAKNTMVPVIKLTQSATDDSGQGWVIHLRSRRRGHLGRVATFEMAHRIVAFLRQTGYNGTIPEERSVPTDLEASLKNQRRGIALFIGGFLASVFAWAAGSFVVGYRQFWDIPYALEMAVSFHPCSICGLPVLALGLLVLWFFVSRRIAGKVNRSTVIWAIIVSVICGFVGGYFSASWTLAFGH